MKVLLPIITFLLISQNLLAAQIGCTPSEINYGHGFNKMFTVKANNGSDVKVTYNVPFYFKCAGNNSTIYLTVPKTNKTLSAMTAMKFINVIENAYKLDNRLDISTFKFISGETGLKFIKRK